MNLVQYRCAVSWLAKEWPAAAYLVEVGGILTMANKEQKKVQKAPPKSNKQKKEMQREKKAAKTGNSLKKE